MAKYDVRYIYGNYGERFVCSSRIYFLIKRKAEKLREKHPLVLIEKQSLFLSLKGIAGKIVWTSYDYLSNGKIYLR